MVGARAHEDHAAALGVDGVLRPLPGQPGDLLGRDAGDLTGPGRGRGRARVVIARRPRTWEPVASNPVVREQQVQDRGDHPVPDPPNRHATRLERHRAIGGVEAGEPHEHLTLAGVQHAQHRLDVAEVEVPLAQALVAITEAHRPARHGNGVGAPVEEHRLPHGVLGRGLRDDRGRQVTGDDELPRGIRAVVLRLERDEEGQVGVAPVVVDEEVDLPVGEVLLEDDVAHAHRERAVDPGPAGDPLVGELDVLGIVGRHGDDLLAAVARLGHPMRVRRAGEGHIGAPHDEVARVPPVARFGHIGLVAEHLRRGVGQVGIPVVEGQHRRADEFEEPRARRIGHWRHRGDRGEAGDPVGSPALDRVDVRGRDELDHLVPRRAHEPTFATGTRVCRPRHRILLDRGPRDDRVAADGGLGLAV